MVLIINILVNNCRKDSTVFFVDFASVLDKDAGFVHKSVRIDTKQTFFTFFFTKRIHETGNSKISSRNESTKRVIWRLDSRIRIRDTHCLGFVCLNYIYVLKIREDSKNSLDSLNLLKIGWIRDPRFKMNLFKSGFVKDLSARNETNLFKSGPKRNESFWS